MLDPPHFDDLSIGLTAEAPALTLTAAHAALHQAILGDRLPFTLDREGAVRLTGAPAPVHPALVWDVAIGQSTILTQRVVANLFYRGLVLRRTVCVGDSLRTRVEVVGLRENRRRPGRAPTGLAVLRVTARDQQNRPVLDFLRCAMLPLSGPDVRTGHADDFATLQPPVRSLDLVASVRGWSPPSLSGRPALEPGRRVEPYGGDVVSSAPELARLTLNIAGAHHDGGRARDGRRLVYGGHVIGLAAAQASRAVPGLLTFLGWHACDHLGPVFEGETVRSSVEVERTEQIDSWPVAHLRSRAHVCRGTAEVPVLDWQFAVVAT